MMYGKCCQIGDVPGVARMVIDLLCGVTRTAYLAMGLLPGVTRMIIELLCGVARLALDL